MLFCLCLLRPRSLSDPSEFPTEFNQCCCCFRCSVSAFEAVHRQNDHNMILCFVQFEPVGTWPYSCFEVCGYTWNTALSIFSLSQGQSLPSCLLIVYLFEVTFCNTHSGLFFCCLMDSYLWPHFPVSVDSYLSSCVKLCKAIYHFWFLEMQIMLSRYRYCRLNDLLSVTRICFALVF